MLLEQVSPHYPTARETGDGAITLPCPVCEAEGRPGEDFTLFANDATSCRHGARGGPDYNRKHCRPVRETLGLTDSPRQALITKVLFDGKLTIECEQSERGKVQLVARNCKSTLSRDIISLSRAKDRSDFIKGLSGFDDDQRGEISQALLQLADEH